MRALLGGRNSRQAGRRSRGRCRGGSLDAGVFV